MAATNRSVFREGDEWSLCERTGWPDNRSYRDLAAWIWLKGEERYLITVNLSDSPLQAHVQLPWKDLAGGTWQLIDALSDVSYERDGNEMLSPGLYVELSPWSYHFLQVVRMGR